LLLFGTRSSCPGKPPKEGFMEKIDILVKGCPLTIHNMFKGYCSMTGKTISEGIIDTMIASIEKSVGKDNAELKAIVDEYKRSGKKK
jgi:hypothetical protein